MSQGELFPREDERLVYVTRDDLPPRERLHCPPPGAALLDSMRKRRWNGVIKLSGMPDGTNRVRDGKRRIWAWDILAEEEREQKLEPYWSSPSMQITAYYCEWTGLEDDVDEFQTNRTAEANRIADFEVVRSMRNDGMSPKDIAAATKTRVTSIEKLLKLERLDSVLLDAFVDGAILYTAADLLASMSKENQARAVDLYLEQGGLSVKDVKGLRRAVAKQNLGTMAQDMFEGLETQFWSTMVEDGTVTIALADGRKFEVEEDEFVAWLESKGDA